MRDEQKEQFRTEIQQLKDDKVVELLVGNTICYGEYREKDSSRPPGYRKTRRITQTMWDRVEILREEVLRRLRFKGVE